MDLKAEHSPDRAWHKVSISERCEIDQPDAVFVSADHSLGDSEGNRGLADTSGPDHRHQPLPRQSRDKCLDVLLAADDPRHRERQVVLRGRERRSRPGPRWLLDAYRRDEIVAPTDNGGDVTMAALTVAERSAQGTDLDLQVGLFDEGLRPDARDQFVLADHLAGALDQKGQNVEGAAAEPHRPIALKQKPLVGKEQERAKRDCASVHRRRPWVRT